MEDKKIIECPHMHKLKTLYTYDMGSDVELHLCEFCNMNLASEIMKQLALEVFCPKFDED